MDRAFEVVVDAFGNVIKITEVDSWESCLVSIVMGILGVILVAAGAVIYLFFMLIINGFKALFAGEIGVALLHFLLPAVLIGFLWYKGWLGTGIKVATSFAGRQIAAVSKGEGTIRGYFIYPDEHFNKGPALSRECFTPGAYNGDYSHSVPEEFRQWVVQDIYCGSYVPSARYLKFDEQGYQKYLDWVDKNGVDGLELVSDTKTTEGKLLAFTGDKNCPKTIIWTVDKYQLLLRLDVRADWGVNACETSLAYLQGVLPFFSQHK